MRRIQKLPPSVVTKIAAGEIIERPASVVKELLENSIDSGCTRMDVEVAQGGADLIRVVDDGGGIAAEDLPLAFASHATSKLADAHDLFRVRTLGFRGEALASIGGVAQVTLQSRPAGQARGAEVVCHGGQLSPVRPWNGTPGTRVDVRHLFFNTPVRRKFLRTPATEAGHVAEVFTRAALAEPGLHLTLRHNDRQVYEVPRSAGLLDHIGLFFGAEVRDRLLALPERGGPVGLRGYVADPCCDRGTPKGQYFFVNRRWIRDRSIGHALQEAYRGLLMTGRYAIVFLYLEVPPDQVDVNVHPTKTEVRFRDGHTIYQLVHSTVRETLRAANLTAPLQRPAGPTPFNGVVPTGLLRPDISGRTPSPAPPVPLTGPVNRPIADGAGGTTARARSTPAGPGKAIQVHDAYLLLEAPDGVLVIDQHALHERILFEKLKGRLAAGEVESQRLLIPEPIDLPPDHAARDREHRAALAALGLQVEDFGGDTLLLTAYPVLLGSRSPSSVLRGGRTPSGPGPASLPGGAAQRLAEPHGLPRGGEGRRPADAGGGRRPAGRARAGREHPPLSPRPAHVAAV